MAASKTRFITPNHHYYFTNELESSSPTFEFTEFDIWDTPSSPSPSPELQTGVKSSRTEKKPVPKRVNRKQMAVSPPVDVPNWSMILKDQLPEHRKVCSYDYDEEFEGDVYGKGDVIPPHEYLASTRMMSFSVQDGVGRDLNKVRDAVWKIIGFED